MKKGQSKKNLYVEIGNMSQSFFEKTFNFQGSNFVLINNSLNIKERISFKDTILYDIVIKTIPKDLRVISESFCSNEKIEFLLEKHKESEKEDSAFLKLFNKKEKTLLRQMENLWEKFYKDYVKEKRQNDTFIIADFNENEIIINKKNGKVKFLDSYEELYNHLIFYKNFIKKSESDFWSELKSILGQENLKLETQCIQEHKNSYYYIEDGECTKLTNWVGEITRAYRGDEEEVVWVLEIEGETVMVYHWMICSPFLFQKELCKKGMKFFYGKKNHLQKLLEFLSKDVSVEDGNALGEVQGDLFG